MVQDSRQSFGDMSPSNKKVEAKKRAERKALYDFVNSPAYPVVRRLLNSNINPYSSTSVQSQDHPLYVIYSTLRDVRDEFWKDVNQIASKHKGDENDD